MDSSSSSSKMCIVYLPSSFFSPPIQSMHHWFQNDCGGRIYRVMGGLLWHISKSNDAWRIISDLGSLERYDYVYWSTFRNLHHFQENTSDSTYPIPDTHVGSNARVALYAQNLFVSTFIKKRKMVRKPFKFSRIARIYELIWQNQIFRMQHENLCIRKAQYFSQWK